MGQDWATLPTEEVVRRVERIAEHASAGMVICEKQAKMLRVACEYGWGAANEFADPAFLNDEGDVARLKRVVTTANAKESANKKYAGRDRHGFQPLNTLTPRGNLHAPRNAPVAAVENPT